MVGEVIVGGTISFQCFGEDNVTWMYENRLLPLNAKTYKNYVIIENVTKRNEGSYLCYGEEESGASPFVGRGLVFTMCN